MAKSFPRGTNQPRTEQTYRAQGTDASEKAIEMVLNKTILCWLKEMGSGSEKPSKFRMEVPECCRDARMSWNQKILLEYVHRSPVFAEVILLSASGGSEKPRAPTAVTACSPDLFICTGLAAQRHRGAVGRAPHSRVPPCWRYWSIMPLLTENAGANNGRDDICERGEILPPTTPSLPLSGDAAPGSCGSRCGPPSVSCLLLHRHPHANRSDEDLC